MEVKNTKQNKEPENLHDLLLIKIASLYDVEHELVKALALMARKATDQHLKEAFRKHMEETRVQVSRLSEVFKLLEVKPKKLKSEAIRGLVKDAQWVMENIADKKARDAALIGAAVYVEHYEMAGYQVAVEWAKKLHYDDVADMLAMTMREEITASDKLREIGILEINRKTLPSSRENAVGVN